ncbi:Jasmonate-zim-domain protein 3, putative isoform 2 [Hibiscus syriacus]|uniref:Protein TIFY n=1 Tax=Hibiscus syriacus TaxID=106335 RepID=A0A6A3A596_HIBSY|nr:Jasmonate-zim-domain protein 3, putative isoform 2 [Hibiscus syriacus]
MPGVSSDSGRGALVPICTDTQGSAVYPLRHCLKSPISRLSVSWSRGHYLRVSVFAAPSSVEDDAEGKIVEVKLSGGDGEKNAVSSLLKISMNSSPYDADWWDYIMNDSLKDVKSQRTMERDFLGLNSEEPWVMVKEELNTDGYKQIGFTKSSGIQWPFSNKVSTVPRLMNFNFAKGDKAKKVGYDPKESPMFMPTSTMNATELQKSFYHYRIGGNYFSSTPSYVQHNGIPVMSPRTILPTLGSVGGSVEPWKSIKTSGSPAQLTIFYGGEVNVFDDITPEKAQAIMFLAGSSSAYPKPQAQTHILKPVQVESVPANQIINTQLNSGASNPHAVAAQSGSGSTSTEDQMICKTSGNRTPSTPISKFEPPKLLNTMGSVAATGMMPSIPQARKASLARFLEKRKERVMNAASPYNFIKKSIDYATTLESSA